MSGIGGGICLKDYFGEHAVSDLARVFGLYFKFKKDGRTEKIEHIEPTKPPRRTRVAGDEVIRALLMGG